MSSTSIEGKNWKALALDSALINSGVEGLIGIEECTDYSLVNGSKKRKNLQPSDEIAPAEPAVIKKPPKKKRKTSKAPSATTDALSLSLTGSTEGTLTEVVNDEDKIIESSAWNDFGLPETVLLALKELGFSQPTEIQALTLPAAIFGRRDILGAAETGSGKTLAFGLPILTGVLEAKKIYEAGPQPTKYCKSYVMDKYGTCRRIALKEGCYFPEPTPFYALILTPTRELAFQVKSHLEAIAKYTGIRIVTLVGGMSSEKQMRLLDQYPEIVVATPGRLWELLQIDHDYLVQVDDVRFLAIDETDRMLEKGHFPELKELIERINLEREKKQFKRQNFVFSATLTLVHELPRRLANKAKVKAARHLEDMTPARKLQQIVDMLGITDPKVVDITRGVGTSDTLTECRIMCKITDKDYYVYYFLNQHPGRTLIFCNSIGCVKRLTTILNLLKCNTLPLHSAMQQRQRLKNLERFRDSDNGILIATDVAARGLDIPGIDHVLHYQTPRTSESYVHRSGRTARATKEGITILLTEPGELRNYIKLCKTLGKSEDLPLFPVSEAHLNAVKQRVNLARSLDKLELQVKKTNSEVGWVQKAAKEMDIIVDEEESMKKDLKETSKLKKTADQQRKQLDSLLAQQIFPKGLSGKYAFSGGNEALLSTLEQGASEKAIDVMKRKVETGKKNKKVIPIYKPGKGRCVSVTSSVREVKLDRPKYKKNNPKVKKNKK